MCACLLLYCVSQSAAAHATAGTVSLYNPTVKTVNNRLSNTGVSLVVAPPIRSQEEDQSSPSPSHITHLSRTRRQEEAQEVSFFVGVGLD